jgi:hypothetical protein
MIISSLLPSSSTSPFCCIICFFGIALSYCSQLYVMPYAIVVVCSWGGAIGVCIVLRITSIGTAVTTSRNGVASEPLATTSLNSATPPQDPSWSLVARLTAGSYISYEFGSTFHIVDQPNPNPRRTVRSWLSHLHFSYPCRLCGLPDMATQAIAQAR